MRTWSKPRLAMKGKSLASTLPPQSPSFGASSRLPRLMPFLKWAAAAGGLPKVKGSGPLDVASGLAGASLPEASRVLPPLPPSRRRCHRSPSASPGWRFHPCRGRAAASGGPTQTLRAAAATGRAAAGTTRGATGARGTAGAGTPWHRRARVTSTGTTRAADASRGTAGAAGAARSTATARRRARAPASAGRARPRAASATRPSAAADRAPGGRAPEGSRSTLGFSARGARGTATYPSSDQKGTERKS